MKRFGFAWLFAAAIMAPGAMAAQDDTPDAAIYGPMEAEGLTLEQFRWEMRPVVVFADSPNDPAFAEQIELLIRRQSELIERDVVIITDTDPANPSDIRRKLRPRGFSIVLVDKEGRVNLRKPFPWDVRELSRAIDKMPIRQQEIREKRQARP